MVVVVIIGVDGGGGGFDLSTLSPLSKEAWCEAGALCEIVSAVYSLVCNGWAPCVMIEDGGDTVAAGTSVFDTHVCSNIGVGEFDVSGLQKKNENL